MKNWKFHHFGLAVKREEPALQFLSALGYTQDEKIFDPLQNVFVRLMTKPGEPAVEIIMPGEGETPLTPLLKKSDSMIYHTCYEVDNLEDALRALEEKNLRVITLSERKPAILFGGRFVSFYNILNYGIVELLEP